MAKLDITINGYNDAIHNMFINGKHVKVKKQDKRKYVANVDVSTNAEIVIYYGHYYYGKAWFWRNLLYFFISVFGIFDSSHNRRCAVVDCKFKLNVVQDTSIEFTLNNFVDGDRFVEYSTETEVEEISNVFYIDKIAKKRKKKMKIACFWITILIIVATILLITLL